MLLVCAMTTDFLDRYSSITLHEPALCILPAYHSFLWHCDFLICLFCQYTRHTL